MHKTLTCLALITLASLSCIEPIESPGRGNELEPREGFIDVEGGKVWFEIAGSGNAIPLILVHGGPGATSRYLEPLRKISDERPVIFFDQLGCGRSERPNDSSLWNIERFVREVEAVRTTLEVQEFHLLGHSWGTMLGVEYVLSHPDRVKGLILASPALSVPKWLEDADRLKSSLPEKLQESIDHHELAGTTDSQEYQAATMEFYRRFLCRLSPWPPELEEALATFGWDVYHTMWGPSEFHATGSLKDYDCTSRLDQIGISTLFTTGRFDGATPETTEWYQSLLPGSSLVIFEDSAHMSMLEEPQKYVQTVREFIHTVEEGLD